MEVLLINGPNLNLLGRRQVGIYGHSSFTEIVQSLIRYGQERNLVIRHKQSNHEGELLDFIHEYGFNTNGIIINPGALTHYSYALADALVAILPKPIIEVHISNVHKREEFRHHSVISAVVTGQIVGLGVDGYFLAIDYLHRILNEIQNKE